MKFADKCGHCGFFTTGNLYTAATNNFLSVLLMFGYNTTLGVFHCIHSNFQFAFSSLYVAHLCRFSWTIYFAPKTSFYCLNSSIQLINHYTLAIEANFDKFQTQCDSPDEWIEKPNLQVLFVF